MFESFLNPGYLAAAGALISAPIIIHLINRMRFKRIHWAAMEFLLKAQKRMRKRLIIEQIILLALRCLLVALVGLLVLRFVGFSFDGRNKQNLHLVLLDDTPSMAEHWKEGENVRDCFTVAKNDVLMGRIVKTLEQTGGNDKLMLLPMTRLVTDKDYQPKTYAKLNDGARSKELREDLESLQCSKVHVDVSEAVKKVRDIVNNNQESIITIHLLSDFRQQDWEVNRPDESAKPGGGEAKGDPKGDPKGNKEAKEGKDGKDAGDNLHNMLVNLAKDNKNLKIRLVDTVGSPYRQTGQPMPASHDNVGIVDMRAGTRIAGKDTPVPFTLTLANYGAREFEVNVNIYDDETGKEILEAAQTFNPQNPIKIPPGYTKKVTFELRFNPVFKPGEPYFAQISARLENLQRGKLDDHLEVDNVRHAAVEVREKVPVLVIDGEGQRGRQENNDTFFIKVAVNSVPGASYDVVYGDELGGGQAAKALERPDLRQFPSIFLLNVRELTDKQLSNLENYVKEGGGVAFFMGPQVNANYYNKKLYNKGQGIFPAPIKDTFTPPANEEPLKLEYTGTPQLHIREREFGVLSAVPIFGQVFSDETQLVRLNDLPIKRYFQVPRSDWHKDASKTYELATLPNRQPINAFQRAVLELVRGKTFEELLRGEDYQKYRPGLERHRMIIERLVGPASEKEAAHLAAALENMLNDQGKKKADVQEKEFPNLTELWHKSEPKIATLRDDVVRLAEQTKYGDPFVIISQYGKGRVAAVMTTAGKEWNDWGGGSDSTLIYQPFIWELQNYLSSQGSESNLLVGSTVQVMVDNEPFKQAKGNARLKMSRVYYQAELNKPAKVIKQSEQFGVEGTGKDHNTYFTFDRNDEPGHYVGLLKVDDGGERPPIVGSFGQTFNVDTVKEGPLGRISSKEIDDNVIEKAPKGSIEFEGPDIDKDKVGSRKSDFSESPWLYLIFMMVLIAEQALAVHLSFHLKGSESDALSRAATAQKQAA